MKKTMLGITLALLAATTMAGNLWVIGKNGSYTGTRYNTDETRFHTFHAGQGEKCVWLETAPEIIGTNTVGRIKRPIYRAPTESELAAATTALLQPVKYDRPVETPALVLPAHDEATPAYGVISAPDGTLVTFIYHASPVPDAAELKRRKDAAVAGHVAAKAALKAEMDELKAKLAAAEAEVTALKTKQADIEKDIVDLKAAKPK